MLGCVGYVGMLGGVLGLHTSQANEYGKLGTVGFVIALIGTVLSLTSGIITVITILLQHQPGNAGALLASIGYLLLIVGFLPLGIATLRARALPAWAGLLLSIGGVVMFLLIPFAGDVFPKLLWLVPGIIWLALSYAIWTRRSETRGTGRRVTT